MSAVGNACSADALRCILQPPLDTGEDNSCTRVCLLLHLCSVPNCLPSCALPLAGRLITGHVLASAAFRDSPHAIVYVHCAKLREVDTTAVLEAGMAAGKRWVASSWTATAVHWLARAGEAVVWGSCPRRTKGGL